MRTPGAHARALPLVVLIAVGFSLGAAEQAALEKGMALVREGDFEAAIVALDAFVRAEESRPGSAQARAQAHLFLGVSYLELDQEVMARAKFREALALDPQMRLDAQEFSPQVIRTFEASRLERPAAPAAAPVAAAAPAPVPADARATEGKGKKKTVPVLLIAGGAAAAGVVLATSGGDDSATTSTSTSTSTTTTTTTSTTTTTTLPAACTFSLSPAEQSFPAAGGNGTCRVSTGAGCGWTGETTESWVQFTGPTNGPGTRTLSFTVAANTDDNEREARIRVRSGGNHAESRCEITQAGTSGATSDAEAARDQLFMTSALDLPGALGQVVLDGAVAAAVQGVATHSFRTAAGRAHRVEAVLVTGEARAGTWRFELRGLELGTLRPVAGRVVSITDRGLVFQVSGHPGERVAFVFQAGRDASDGSPHSRP